MTGANIKRPPVGQTGGQGNSTGGVEMIRATSTTVWSRGYSANVRKELANLSAECADA